MKNLYDNVYLASYVDLFMNFTRYKFGSSHEKFDVSPRPREVRLKLQ